MKSFLSLVILGVVCAGCKSTHSVDSLPSPHSSCAITRQESEVLARLAAMDSANTDLVEWLLERQHVRDEMHVYFKPDAWKSIETKATGGKSWKHFDMTKYEKECEENQKRLKDEIQKVDQEIDTVWAEALTNNPAFRPLAVLILEEGDPAKKGRTVYLTHNYGFLVKWLSADQDFGSDTNQEFFIYERPSRRITTTSDFSTFLESLKSLPSGITIDWIGCCSTLFSNGMPYQERDRLYKVIDEKGFCLDAQGGVDSMISGTPKVIFIKKTE